MKLSGSKINFNYFCLKLWDWSFKEEKIYNVTKQLQYTLNVFIWLIY